jgi:murein L,D-transpeptidase YcbB/YkuD
MKYLVFNPTWTIPYSIATQEILPKLKKDSTYLSDKNMTLLNASGVAINQRSVDWSTVTPSNFYYTIREEPGPANALGQVKFMFPNNYSVYLHDTPSKYLFARDDRAFSHGCIRVQSPLKLAEVLLNDTKWDQEKIKQVIDEKKETVVYLKKPIDILLLYWTCGFYDNKDVFFLKDIYNRDQKVLEQLQNNDWEKLIPYYRKEISSSAG